MTLEEIDQLLADWRKKLDLVSRNLIDLHGLSAYQRLSGVSGFPKTKLTGLTQARVTPAIEAMNDLLQHFDLLSQTVEQATKLRSSVPWFLVSEQKVQEIEQILTGPSIQLPAVQTPLAQRGLLCAAETASAIAPEKLLMVMTNAFEVARDAVLAVDEAWSRLEPKLISTEAEIISLQKLADSLNIGALSELSVASQKIASLHESIESDPLGVSADFDREIQPLISQVKTTLEQLVKQQTQIRKNLEIGHELLKQLVELHRQAEAAFAESREKVGDHPGVQSPLDPETINALSQWLNRLETKFTEGLLNPVRVGLDNWMAKAREYIAAEEKACVANNAPLKLRQELRGRLDALQAKALARGLVEDAVLTELAEQAKQLLYTRPTPLQKAADLVSQYEKRLNSQPRSVKVSP